MADNAVSDLIMKFETKPGQPIEGESLTVLDLLKGDMTKGFKKGYMFEVESFTFRAGVSGEDEDSKNKQKDETAARKQSKEQNRINQTMHVASGAKGPPPPLLEVGAKPTSVGAFSKWRAGQEAKYPVDISPVEFSRAIDKASTILLQNCIRRVTYDSATLIKRKSAGSRSSGEVYLRFDFTGVMMTRIDWDNDDPIKEKCQFICRAVTVSYRPQLPDGTLGAVVPGFWTMTTDLKQVNLKG